MAFTFDLNNEPSSVKISEKTNTLSTLSAHEICLLVSVSDLC